MTVTKWVWKRVAKGLFWRGMGKRPATEKEERARHEDGGGGGGSGKRSPRSSGGRTVVGDVIEISSDDDDDTTPAGGTLELSWKKRRGSWRALTHTTPIPPLFQVCFSFSQPSLNTQSFFQGLPQKKKIAHTKTPQSQLSSRHRRLAWPWWLEEAVLRKCAAR